MDSNIIKTYLLDYIFDILENNKFRYLVFPHSQDTFHSSTSKSVPKSRQDRVKDSLKEGILYLVQDSFMVCVSKVISTLLVERSVGGQRLYNEMFERLGEIMLIIVGKLVGHRQSTIFARSEDEVKRIRGGLQANQGIAETAYML